MGTETYSGFPRHMHLFFDVVKLNNPLMGTETLNHLYNKLQDILFGLN